MSTLTAGRFPQNSSATGRRWPPSTRRWSRSCETSAIELGDGRELRAKAKIVGHEYKIPRRHKIAEICKRWFRIRDTYGIEVAPGENDALILAATICIDEPARD